MTTADFSISNTSLENRYITSVITSYKQLSCTEVNDRLTHTEAETLLNELQYWAGQFCHDEAHTLNKALSDMKRLQVRVWTEIDESLSWLSRAKSDPRNAEEHIQIAMKLLSRWQDRGGRIGNASSEN